MNILILITTLMSCSNKVFKLKNKGLLEAAQKGDVGEVTKLIREGTDVNDSNGYGSTALIFASENGHVEAIKALIQGGANVNNARPDGSTALMFAAQEGHEEAIRALIQAGADVNQADEDGQTALVLAAQEGHVEAIRALIEAGADVNEALMMAAGNGHVEAIKALIQVGANVNNARPDGGTALMFAAQEGHVEAIRALIEGGANVNHARPDGGTALMWAAYNGHVEAIKALIEAKARLYRFTLDELTESMIASISRYPQAIRTLTKDQHSEAIRTLIEVGKAKVNVSRKDWYTALMLAAKKGYLLFFMKLYAKRKFNFPDDVSEPILVNSAFILLLQLLDTDICINQVTNICEIRQEHINQFLSDLLIDLSSKFALTSNGITLEMNLIEIIYKNLLIDLFDSIYKSDKKDEMMTVVKEKMSYVKKLEMLKYIIFRNKEKLMAILTNTTEQDSKANEKREVLQNMVKPLLEVNGHHAKAAGITVDMIYIIFKDKLTSDFMIELRDNGWNFQDLSSLDSTQ